MQGDASDNPKRAETRGGKKSRWRSVKKSLAPHAPVVIALAAVGSLILLLFQSLDGDIDRLTNQMQKLGGDVGYIKGDLSHLKERTDQIENRMQELDGRMRTLGSSVDYIRGHLDNLNVGENEPPSAPDRPSLTSVK